MNFKYLSILLIVIALFYTTFLFGIPTKNRILIAEGDIIKLFEFNSDTEKFDIIWESAETGTGIKSSTSGIVGMALEDMDGDGKNELVAIDQFGIFVWGKTGRVPQYYNLENAVSQRNSSYIVPFDLDEDGVYEFVTQRSFGFNQRKIEAFRIDGLDLMNIAEIELPGGVSWSVRNGDCDNDEEEDIITAAEFIHILGWEKSKGFSEKARFSHNSTLVDVVRIADIDGDGNNEILASGNSGCFTVYKARKSRSTGEITYPVVFHSQDHGGYIQGLEIADLDGDSKKEILIGVTDRVSPRGPAKNKNIVVYEYEGGETTPGGTAKLSLRKTLSLFYESSSIPGFSAGDIDGDGRDEVVYNNKYVLRFERNSENNLECEVIAKLVDQGSACVIGSFEPTEEDKFTSVRIIPQNLYIGLNKRDAIEAGKTYKLWTKVISPWNTARDVRIQLESDTENIKIKNGDFVLPQMEAGKIYDNSKIPFQVSPGDISEAKDFKLKLFISTDDGYSLSQSYQMGQSRDGANIMFSAVPKFVPSSDTLAFSNDRDIYADLGISYDFYDDNYGSKGWLSNENLLKYKNIIIQKEWGLLPRQQKDNLKSFLDNGGNILAHGHLVIFIHPRDEKKKPELRDFIETYFRCRSDKVFEGKRELTGKPGDLISDSLSFQLKDYQGSISPDIIDVLSNAIPIFFYPSGEVAGIRIEGKYKMIYLGFRLEEIQSIETKRELIKRILDWFNSQ